MKAAITAACLASLMSVSAFAAYTGPNSGQTKGTAPQQVETVKAALEAADDTPVILEGQITRQVGEDDYEFRDATGEVKVEIDHDKWPAGVTVSETQKVRLVGEVDRDAKGVEVDVDRIQLVK
ncbi:NirD/YgiW/YdeI family stress tolerance protein [Pseudomonas sp. RIT-PI-S]|uniref:YgiW/YdeI family stress tolerance OB fold protein n=1 Tax=Pseudomonas sp. RIT-PI-S TaxID=3035295 RepID=UPI0021D8BCFF|nr:NirD/YgiW/YdeI family stress tolerance protein [Pseudomonas sp. RIT-PI-S]